MQAAEQAWPLHWLAPLDIFTIRIYFVEAKLAVAASRLPHFKYAVREPLFLRDRSFFVVAE